MFSRKAVAFLVLSMLFSANWSNAASSFSWGEQSASYTVKDQLGNLLPFSKTVGTSGAWAQLIYAGANGTTNDFIFSGLGVTSDDRVIDVNYSSNGSFLGAAAGMFSYQTAGTNDIPNGNYYVRVFNVANSDWASDTNAAVPAAATYYYQSELHAYSYSTATDPVDQWLFTDNVQRQTLIPTAIPEPATSALFFLGLITVAGLRRRSGK